MIEKTEIQFNKLNLFLLALGSIGFVVMGICFALYPSQVEPNQQLLIRIIGGVTILFFGTCSIFITRQLFSKQIGLMIDENGITDNSSGTSVGLIDWDDIIEIDTLKVASTKFVLIRIKDANKYINRASDAISKRAMKSNHKTYGTPLSILSNTLKIKHDELLNKINESFKTMKKKKTTP